MRILRLVALGWWHCNLMLRCMYRCVWQRYCCGHLWQPNHLSQRLCLCRCLCRSLRHATCCMLHAQLFSQLTVRIFASLATCNFSLQAASVCRLQFPATHTHTHTHIYSIYKYRYDVHTYIHTFMYVARIFV